MIDISSILLLLGVGIAAGFMNVMAGGGSTIALPILIFLGLDPSVANGTNRVAIALQNVSAIASFRQEKYSEFKTSMKMAIFTLPGGIAGAIFAVRISDELFQTILGFVMIGVVISMLIPRKKITGEAPAEKTSPWIYAAMFGIGFYGGFIQVGVGFLLMAAIYNLLKISLANVNMHKVFVVLVYTIPALVVFILTDNVNWGLGLALAAGNATGGWFAAKFSVKKGDKLIRYVLIVAIFIMSLKLLGVF
ncbi:MAG: sulfite exporter TauE/SafE family protein [Candidatus Kapaibacterium sp.]